MAYSANSGTSTSEITKQPMKNDTTIVTTIGRLWKYSRWNTGSSARCSTARNATTAAIAAKSGASTDGCTADVPKAAKSMFFRPRSNSSMKSANSTEPATSILARDSSISLSGSSVAATTIMAMQNGTHR